MHLAFKSAFNQNGSASKEILVKAIPMHGLNGNISLSFSIHYYYYYFSLNIKNTIHIKFENYIW